MHGAAGSRGWARGRILLSPPPLRGNRGAVRAQGSNPRLMYTITWSPSLPQDRLISSWFLTLGRGLGGTNHSHKNFTT